MNGEARRFRMGSWFLITIILLCVVAIISPQQIPVLLNKLTLLTTAAYIGYYIDRSAYPYCRPHQTNSDLLHAAAMIRRAIIMGAAMLTVGMGL